MHPATKICQKCLTLDLWRNARTERWISYVPHTILAVTSMRGQNAGGKSHVLHRGWRRLVGGDSFRCCALKLGCCLEPMRCRWVSAANHASALSGIALSGMASSGIGTALSGTALSCLSTSTRAARRTRPATRARRPSPRA